MCCALYNVVYLCYLTILVYIKTFIYIYFYKGLHKDACILHKPYCLNLIMYIYVHIVYVCECRHLCMSIVYTRSLSNKVR